ncbi:MAG: DUF3341 domain-containing protein [Deltaproteobacteria bacterium]|nr:DUF3341 domain-containing protein [Deltaproteobacteria bacterium]
MAEYSTNEQLPDEKLWGVLAEFSGPGDIFRACERVRDAGYTRWDSYTPYPVRNLDKAMGLSASKVPWVVFFLGILGAVGGMTLQWWASVVEYPIVYGAKPFFSWQAFVPVTFELGVLCASLAAFFGLLHFARLPQHYHPLFTSERFQGVTDDKFFIAIEAADGKFNLQETVDLLRSVGATQVEEVAG